MASKTRTLPIQTTALESIRSVRSKHLRAAGRNSIQAQGRAIATSPKIDFVISHNAADAAWSEQLFERIRGDRLGNRQLVTRLASWDFSSAAGILADAEECIRTCRFFGLVVSLRRLQEDWPALEKLISVLKDFGLPKGRFVTLLKENVTLPPLLRMQEWIDFRDVHRFEESVCDLLAILREDQASPVGIPRLPIGDETRETAVSAWKIRPIFAGAAKVRERIVSNLFPVVEIPRDIFSAETRFQSESEITEVCGGPGPVPFLLKGSRIYSVAPLTENSVFAPVLNGDGNPSQERFTNWLSEPERAPWAIELLDHFLRYHAWKRGLRFEAGQGLFYFTRSKPKNLWWEIGGKTIQREVTAPHMKWIPLENNGVAEFQCGWKHEAIRAGFIQILGALYLRLEPAWFLTELDGRTPSTSHPVGPVNSFPSNQEKSGQILRTLRFWSAVFAKGHRELRIDGGTNPIRVRLTPASGSSQSAFSNDQMDFDSLALADLDDAQLIPELAPIEQ
jgi:hypothetical protein